jgi:hypothetical protein
VYAGAAREAVFSVPAVIRRVEADFIPLALRAPLVNGADGVRDKDERWLYQRINRVKLAPQGICVLDAGGRVLLWTQMFDDDPSVLAFLDRALDRFREKAGLPGPEVTERYVRFPGMKDKDFQDPTRIPPIAEGHAEGKRCPSQVVKGEGPPGSLRARLVGRAVDARGEPLADTVKQEHYVEDRFAIAPVVQEAVAEALAAGGPDRVRLPNALARECATHAHLGHIDVQPLFFQGESHHNKGEWKKCDFWARRAEGDKALWRIEGESEVVSELSINVIGHGVHNVQLAWEGFVEVQGKRLTRLVLAAHGREKLQFSTGDHPARKENRPEVSFLFAGRPIDLECGVRYGLVAEAAAGGAAARESAEPVPDEARHQLTQTFGGPFLVFHDKVAKELKLSTEQKEKLDQELPERLQDAMKFFESIHDVKSPEREKQFAAYRRKVHDKLAAFLKETLKDDQSKRLRQIELQQEGAFTLGGEVGKELKITDDQRKQFMAVHQELQKKVESLVKEAQSGGKPEEVRPRIMKLRKEYEAKIVAILTEAQKTQWKEMLGQPIDLEE